MNADTYKLTDAGVHRDTELYYRVIASGPDGVTPALSVILLARAPLERREAPLARWLKRGYAGALSRVVQRPRWAYLVAELAGRAAVDVILGPEE